MNTALASGLGLALGSALVLNAGFLLQQGAAAGTPELSLRRPLASLRSLLASRRWLFGFCLGLGGWALYFAALALAPLSLVQTVAASGIGLLVVIAAGAARTLPPRRERAGAVLAALGLMALAAGLGTSGAVTSRAPSAAGFGAVALGVIVVVALAIRRRSASLGGLAAGLCYGIGDVASKAMLIALPHHPGPAAFAASPYLYATAGAHGLGFVLLQRAFQHSGAIASLGPMTAAMNLLPMAAGVVLLGERLPAGEPALALRIAAFAAAVAGAWLLAGRSAPPQASEPAAEYASWLQPPLPSPVR